MSEISLPRATWMVDEQSPLGKGGFGAVFRGQSVSGEPVAVKKLFSGYQQREMKIADYLLGHDHPHIIPILDAGFDGRYGANFIVMSLAEQNLQDLIDAHAPIQEGEALDILFSIVQGLTEIGPVVHRDMKPANILLHRGVWKIADLGLARFVEDSTSLNTMKGALSPSYGAPEQWRIERSTKATDIYATGCIIYALLEGKPPFVGPTKADYSYQHQFKVPHRLNGSAHIRRMAASCLNKVPEARPSTASLAAQIRDALSPASKNGSLAEAAARLAEGNAAEEQRITQEKIKETGRVALAAEANKALEEIFAELIEKAFREAPNARVARIPSRGAHGVELGNSCLQYWMPCFIKEGTNVGSMNWDVVSGAAILAGTGMNPSWPERGANLWYGQLLKDDDFRWWEVTYVLAEHADPSIKSRKWEPFPIGVEYPETLHSPSISDCLVAEDPIPVTHGHIEQFIDRWVEHFGKMAMLGGQSRDSFASLRKYQRKPIAKAFNLDK